MSVTANQRRLLLDLLASLRPFWRHDRNLPARLATWLAAHRAGSRDRRLYRELAYTALRLLPWIESADDDTVVGLVAAEAADGPATAAFRAAFARPELAAARDRSELFPAWLAGEAPLVAATPAQRDALLTRAPLWVRRQSGSDAAVAEELTTRGWSIERSSLLPTAWRLEADVPVADTEAYRTGRIEIQDLGSQLILAAAGVRPGGQWFDACAGAGGKSLQLAQLLGPAGHVTAHDIRPAALAELRSRAARSGIRQITTTPAPPAGTFDGVLVDAPCTGTGTWRRAPHLIWTTTPSDVAAAAALQLELLTRFSGRVRPGGKLIYATCSICQRENEAVARAFGEAHPEFQPLPVPTGFVLTPMAPGAAILPATQDTDGFYFASFERRA